MPTAKKRINITLEDDVAIFLEKISLRENVPQATKAAELLETALEIEEDAFFGRLAEKRDVKGAKFVSHEDVWKK